MAGEGSEPPLKGETFKGGLQRGALKGALKGASKGASKGFQRVASNASLFRSTP